MERLHYITAGAAFVPAQYNSVLFFFFLLHLHACIFIFIFFVKKAVFGNKQKTNKKKKTTGTYKETFTDVGLGKTDVPYPGHCVLWSVSHRFSSGIPRVRRTGAST